MKSMTTEGVMMMLWKIRYTSKGEPKVETQTIDCSKECNECGGCDCKTLKDGACHFAIPHCNCPSGVKETAVPFGQKPDRYDHIVGVTKTMSARIRNQRKALAALEKENEKLRFALKSSQRTNKMLRVFAQAQNEIIEDLDAARTEAYELIQGA
jgi:hypothetical protein